MDIERRLLDIERKPWTNDPVFYENNLIEEALLVFSETGVITRAVALDAMRQENAEGRRWADVEFKEVCTVQPTDSICLLTYTVAARWEHEKPKVFALASSVYIKRDGIWKLAWHQQTPIQAVKPHELRQWFGRGTWVA
jgi:hypothetical protein